MLRNDADPDWDSPTSDELEAFSAVIDTGPGPNLIRKSALFDGWERYLVRDEAVPRLG